MRLPFPWLGVMALNQRGRQCLKSLQGRWRPRRAQSLLYRTPHFSETFFVYAEARARDRANRSLRSNFQVGEARLLIISAGSDDPTEPCSKTVCPRRNAPALPNGSTAKTWITFAGHTGRRLLRTWPHHPRRR